VGEGLGEGVQGVHHRVALRVLHQSVLVQGHQRQMLRKFIAIGSK
jgi:hypothetical protein